MTKLAVVLLASVPLGTVSFAIERIASLHHTAVSTFGCLTGLQATNTAVTLLPEENPTGDPTKKSKSGVTYANVLDGLHQLYPPSDLAKRNAASRTDGYWPFIQKGQDPPQQLTYGEFDFYFFAELLDRAQELYYCYQGTDERRSWDDKVFCDIGSGTGRLVMAAAALHPGWKLCRGIELLKSIHVVAEETLAKCDSKGSAESVVFPTQKPVLSSLVGEEDILNQFQGKFILDGECEPENQSSNAILGEEAASSTSGSYYLPSSNESDEEIKLAPVDLVCGSFDDTSVYFGDSDCIFVFSSCMSRSIIAGLSEAIGRQCKPGTIVITTEFPLNLEGMVDPSNDPDELKHSHCDYDGDFDDPDDAEEWVRFCAEEGIESRPFKFELIESIDGYCWLTGGLSTAHIHRVVISARREGDTPPTAGEISSEEMAAMAWMYALKQQSSDFYRDVRNNMIFHGFSEKWYNDLND